MARAFYAIHVPAFHFNKKSFQTMKAFFISVAIRANLQTIATKNGFSIENPFFHLIYLFNYRFKAKLALNCLDVPCSMKSTVNQ